LKTLTISLEYLNILKKIFKKANYPRIPPPRNLQKIEIREHNTFLEIRKKYIEDI